MTRKPKYTKPAIPLCCAYKNNGIDLDHIKQDVIANPNHMHRSLCAIAVNHGHLECLQNARKDGWPWSKLICYTASAKNYWKCLMWAHENGCEWGESACEIATIKGHLKCLKLLYENGCPLIKDICTIAAANGHLKCLKYLDSLDHFNILWCVNFDTYKVAVEKNHPKCAKYVSENLGVVTFDGGMKITPLCEVLLCNN